MKSCTLTTGSSSAKIFVWLYSKAKRLVTVRVTRLLVLEIRLGALHDLVNRQAAALGKKKTNKIKVFQVLLICHEE